MYKWYVYQNSGIYLEYELETDVFIKSNFLAGRRQIDKVCIRFNV